MNYLSALFLLVLLVFFIPGLILIVIGLIKLIIEKINPNTAKSTPKSTNPVWSPPTMPYNQYVFCRHCAENIRLSFGGQDFCSCCGKNLEIYKKDLLLRFNQSNLYPECCFTDSLDNVNWHTYRNNGIVTLCDAFGNPAATVQRVFGLQPRYKITIGKQIYSLLPEYTFPPVFRCKIRDTSIRVHGKKIARYRMPGLIIPNLAVCLDQAVIMHFYLNQTESQKYSSDTIYNLHILNEGHEIMCLCLTLALSGAVY